jgi:HD domain-containing protein
MVDHAADNVSGISVPATRLARAITEHVRDVEDDVLFHHSRRVYFFGAMHGRRRGLEADLDLLYAGAMFHDVGLTEPYRSTSSLRFEIDSANAARDFVLQHGVDGASARLVWLGIALHTTPGVPEFLEPEVALVTAGVETDVLGWGRDSLAADELEAVIAAHPRPDFKRRILHEFSEGMRRRPGTTFGTVNADVLEHDDPTFTRQDFVEIITSSGWPE